MYNVLLQRKVKIECACIMYNGIIVTVNKSDRKYVHNNYCGKPTCNGCFQDSI